jgi:hypothetical protein
MRELESTVADIVARLRQGRYPNEQSISQGIVLRLLQAEPHCCEARRRDVVVAANLGCNSAAAAQHPDSRGRKRAYIARTAEELYPDRPDLREHHESLDGGWLVATNLNNALKKTIIQLACDVAGITFGKDVVVQF